MFSTSCEELDSEVEGKDKLMALEDEKREELLDPAIFFRMKPSIFTITLYITNVSVQREVDECLLLIPL